jgi:putative DNA primase/helicase
MTDINSRGATPDEWFHFDFVLGLGGNLLPCVPAGDDVRVLAGSALEGKVGKIPSQFNRNGEAHGLKDWQKREILSNELQLWQADPRLNICVRTGPISGVYAFDIDIDSDQAGAVRSLVADALGTELPVRSRANSQKILLAFRMETPCKKRKIKLDSNPKGSAIELLADGQQFVAAGTHSSGVRYQWSPELPSSLPTISMEQLNQMWSQLTKTYAMTSSAKDNQIALDGAATTTPSTKETSSPSPLDSLHEALTSCSEEDWSRLLAALRFMLDKVESNDTWSEVGYALLSLQATRPIRQLWSDFSRKAAGYQEGAPEAWWDAHCRQNTRTDYRHIFTMARERGMARVADPEAFPPIPADTSAGTDTSEQTVGADSGGPNGPDSTDTGGRDASVVLSPQPSQPVIQLTVGNYSDIIDQMEQLMVPEIYVQGPHLTRQSQGHDDANIRRSDDALMLIQVTGEWLKKRFGETAIIRKYLKSEAAWVKADLTTDYVNGLLNLGGWTRLRPLNAIARAPFVRADGSICDVPGYDPRARVLYVPGTKYPAIPADPDRDCAREAIERIRGVFDQFPWKEPASESAFLSHILAEAGRLAIDCCPIYFYDAPSAGTGKGLLQDMAARIVHGSNPAIRTWVGDGDEIRKTLYAALLAGDRSVWFDNVPTGVKVRSPELCAFITSETWTDRKLGKSETLGVPNKCILVASGNNVTPVSDLARRSLVVRLDANTEKLKERVFKIPEGMLRPYVMEHRPQMLVDALTVIKAYMSVKDKPKMPVPLQSFGQWSQFCRDPLIWLGFADPVITQKETDDENASVGTVFQRLFEQFGGREFTGLDVARLVNGIADPNGELANELMDNGCAEPNQPKKVGYWLRGCRDRISHGLKLTHAGEARGGMKWKLIKTHEDLT